MAPLRHRVRRVLGFVTITAIVGAGICLGYAIFAMYRKGGSSPEDRVAALVAAVLLALVAAVAAAVDDKVANASQRGGAAATTHSLTVAGKDLAAFESVEEVHTGPLRADLCVVRFYTRGVPPKGKWWTTCDLADTKLGTVTDVRRELAIRSDWGGDSNEKVTYVVPKGTTVTYVRGPAAEQCAAHEKPCRYPGGGEQFLFPDELTPPDGSKTECADANGKYGPCS